MPTHVISVDGNTADPTTGSVQTVLSVTRALNHAELLTLPTTPILLVASPGIGKFINILSAKFKTKINASYLQSDGNILTQDSKVSITWGPNQAYASKAVRADFLLGTNTSYSLLGGTANVNDLTNYINISPAWCENKALYAASDSIDGLDYTGGHAADEFIMQVTYEIVEL